MQVRDFQAVIGKEVRHQCLEKMGGDPDILLACVGGGSNAIGLFHEFVDDAHVRLIGGAILHTQAPLHPSACPLAPPPPLPPNAPHAPQSRKCHPSYPLHNEFSLTPPQSTPHAKLMHAATSLHSACKSTCVHLACLPPAPPLSPPACPGPALFLHAGHQLLSPQYLAAAGASFKSPLTHM